MTEQQQHVRPPHPREPVDAPVPGDGSANLGLPPLADVPDVPEVAYTSAPDVPEVVPNRAERRAAGHRSAAEDTEERRPNHLLRVGALGLLIGGIAVSQFVGIPLAVAAAGAAGGATIGAGAYGAHRLRKARRSSSSNRSNRSGGLLPRALRTRSGGNARSGLFGGTGRTNRTGSRAGNRSGFGSIGLGRSSRRSAGRSGGTAGHRSGGHSRGRARSGLLGGGQSTRSGLGAGRRSGTTGRGGSSSSWRSSGTGHRRTPPPPPVGSRRYNRNQMAEARTQHRIALAKARWARADALRDARRVRWASRRARALRATGRGIAWTAKWGVGVPVMFAGIGAGRGAAWAARWTWQRRAYVPLWYRNTVALIAQTAAWSATQTYLTRVTRSLWATLLRLPAWIWTAARHARREHPLRAEMWTDKPPHSPPAPLTVDHTPTPARPPVPAPVPALALPPARRAIPMPPAPPRVPATTRRGALMSEDEALHPSCEAVVDAFREHIGGFELPDSDGFEQLDWFFRSWGSMFAEMGLIVHGLADNFVSDTPIDNAVAEHMQDAGGAFGEVSEEWTEVYATWAVAHESDRIRAEGERGPHEQIFNVS